MSYKLQVQQVSVTTSDNFQTAADVTVSPPDGYTGISHLIGVAQSAPAPNAGGTTKTTTYTITAIWTD